MIETARLRLRGFQEADRQPLRAMWRDPAVMAELGPIKSDADSDATIARHLGYGTSHGLGFWIVELRDTPGAIGFAGLKPGAPGTPVEGELEIGWMFMQPAWGRGFAREAAEAALQWAWANHDAERVVAITAATNLASQALMARLEMIRFAAFEHPNFPIGDRLRPTLAFAISRPTEAAVA